MRLGSEFDSPRDNFRLASRKLSNQVLERRLNALSLNNAKSGPGTQVTDNQAQQRSIVSAPDRNLTGVGIQTHSDPMPRTRDQILENRRRLRADYGEFLDSTAALLLRHDPIGISFEVNTDEYLTEAETILPRLCNCHAAEDALQVVHEEFVRWFNSDKVGPPEHYKEIASEVRQLWQEHRPVMPYEARESQCRL